MFDTENLKFDDKGLIPVITQDFTTGEVLMLAYMNKEALLKTLEGGLMCYYSRSRSELWLKGETSGHYQKVVSASYDCDEDALLFKVNQEGAACHTGNKSCFYRHMYRAENAASPVGSSMLEELCGTIEDRRDNPKEGSYTNYLFEKGIDKILKKVGEETSETIIAAKNHDKKEITNEIADLIYHLSVLLVHERLKWADVLAELVNRHKR